VEGFEHRLVIDSPAMPEWLEWLKIENLRVGEGAVSLLLRRTPRAPKVEILETRGPVGVEIK
jgi:hypothetical protein